MIPDLSTPPTLDDATVRAVKSLVDAAVATDHVSPLNEAAIFALTSSDVDHLVARIDGAVVGYGQHDRQTDSSQIVVTPGQRGHGVGEALSEAMVSSYPSTTMWAFGNLRGAQALVKRFGYVAVRELLIMGRPLDRIDPWTAPPGVTIRSYRPTDADQVLEVNAAAFAHHPEQGDLSRADFDQRTASDWFDPGGLIVAEDAGGRLLGFHWTKRHDQRTGEVYVLCTAPWASGLGLGQVLLNAGLDYLAKIGCLRVILYVESDNARAVRLYGAGGFEVVRSDIMYAPGGTP